MQRVVLVAIIVGDGGGTAGEVITGQIVDLVLQVVNLVLEIAAAGSAVVASITVAGSFGDVAQATDTHSHLIRHILISVHIYIVTL